MASSSSTSSSGAGSLDLDVSHYSAADLRRFLDLPADPARYTDVDVERRCVVIREVLLQSGSVDKKFKARLFQFLGAAKARLRQQEGDAPSSLPLGQQQSRARMERTGGLAGGVLVPTPKTETLYESELAAAASSASSAASSSSSAPAAAALSAARARPFEVLNPHEKRFVTKLVCVDSLFRENYSKTSPTNFVYKLDAPVTNVVSMNLTSVEIPFYWYTIGAANKNNVFSVHVHNLQFNGAPLGPQEYAGLTIPDGNYGSAQIVSVINNLFTASTTYAPDGNVCGLNFLTCQVNQVNLKTVFRENVFGLDSIVVNPTSPALGYPRAPTLGLDAAGQPVANPYFSPAFAFTVRFDAPAPAAGAASLPLYRTLGWTLGFRKSRYVVDGPAFAFDSIYESINYANATNGAPVPCPARFRNYLASESPYGCNIDNYVFVCVDDFQKNYATDTVSMINSSNRTLVTKNVLGRVTLAQGFNSIIVENNADFLFRRRDYFGPVNIEKLAVSVINRHGECIDINQADLSLTLELKIMYS